MSIIDNLEAQFAILGLSPANTLHQTALTSQHCNLQVRLTDRCAWCTVCTALLQPLEPPWLVAKLAEAANVGLPLRIVSTVC